MLLEVFEEAELAGVEVLLVDAADRSLASLSAKLADRVAASVN